MKFNPKSPEEVWSEGWSEVRLIAAIRWLLATTGLTIIYLDPKEPDNKIWWVTYVALAAYVLYSTILYLLAIRRVVLRSGFEFWSHWIDVAWFTVLISMSTGTNRIFFFGFLFAILVASFRRGFKAGISVVIVSTLSITIIGFAAETASFGFEGYSFDVYRFMLRPTFLIVLGYLMAHWGESEIQSKRRLALLKDITLANPRLGVDRTIASILESLRNFYHADLGFVVVNDPAPGRHVSYRAEPHTEPGSIHREEISDDFSRALLALPSSTAVCYSCGRVPVKSSGRKIQSLDVLTGDSSDEPRAVVEALADRFDAASYISAPIFRHNEVSGRIFFTRTRGPAFQMSDVGFLLNVMKHANPIIENIRLVDTLATDAAERERRRIARDIHDSIIQPYIGFQIALSGLRRKLDAGQPNVSAEVQKLTEMTAVGVSDLRQYVRKLKDPGEHETTLIPAIQRFTAKFSDATGINVQIDIPAALVIDERLAAEVFQMITEGLSNIRKHTEATNAFVKISSDQKILSLSIENDCNRQSEAFKPKSINERATALNGSTQVERGAHRTAVRVEIPL